MRKILRSIGCRQGVRRASFVGFAAVLALLVPVAAGADAGAAPDPDHPVLQPGPSMTLASALRAADGRSVTLAVLRQELDRADAQLSQAWALVTPYVGAGLQYTHADHADTADFASGMKPIFDALGITLPEGSNEPMVIRRQESVSGSMSVALPLVNVRNWFTLSAAYKGRDVAGLTVENARQQLLVGTAQAWYAARMSATIVGLHETQIASAAMHLDFATKRFASGSELRLDVVRAETELFAARQQLVNALLALDTARDALGVLTGTDGLPMPEASPDLVPPEGDEASLERQALSERPDVRLAEASIRLARAQVTGAIGGFLPTADLVWAGSYQFTEPSSLGSTDRSRWNLILNLNVPLFQWANFGKLREQQASLRIARLKADDARDRATQEVRQARRDWKSARSAEELAARQIELAREAMGLAQTAYEAGAGSSLDVTDARRTLTAAEVNGLMARLKTQMAVLGLTRALGQDVLERVAE